MSAADSSKRSAELAFPDTPLPSTSKKSSTASSASAAAAPGLLMHPAIDDSCYNATHFVSPSSLPPTASSHVEPVGGQDAVLDGRGRAKIALFDVEGTLIKTKSGKRFAKDIDDWQWWHPSVPTKLQQLFADGFGILLLANQVSPAPQRNGTFHRSQKLFMELMGGAFATELGIPFTIMAAQKTDQYKKPSPGMWLAFETSLNKGVKIEIAQSLFVGDSAGRPGAGARSADYSCCDREMAMNLGIKFSTPEEYFLDTNVDSEWAVSKFDVSTHDHSLPLCIPQSTMIVPAPTDRAVEVILFVGFPASGKSSFYSRYFKPASYVHVNQDLLKSRPKCISLIRTSLSASPPRSCVIDNTNRDISTRSLYLALKVDFPHVRFRCFHFVASEEMARHNSVFRSLYPKEGEDRREVLPGIAFSSYAKGFEEPRMEEGFDEMVQVNFKFEGGLQRYSQRLGIYFP